MHGHFKVNDDSYQVARFSWRHFSVISHISASKKCRHGRRYVIYRLQPLKLMMRHSRCLMDHLQDDVVNDLRGAHRSCLGPPPQSCASPGLSSMCLAWEPAWLQVALGCPALSIPLLSFSLFTWLSHPFQVSIFLRHMRPFPWPRYPDSSCCLQAGH